MEDYADQAIARMRSPRDMHIICVDVTNKCDLHCSNCTRLLKNQAGLWEMTPDNFRAALRSLQGYEGVIAMIGGNPCMHKKFAELCKIFEEEVPNKRQRGLWSNNLFDQQQLIADTFGFFNLNPHNDERGMKSLEKLKELIPQINYFKGHSHHSPLMTAMRDVYPDPREMWDVIPTCDINRDWSATIIQNKGELRVYFCEVAASFDLSRGEDHGHPVTPGWWNTVITQYADQVKHFCPGCGVPARLKGHLDIEQTDTYTPSNADIALPSKAKKKRKIIAISSPDEVQKLANKFTNYNQHDLCREDASRNGAIGQVFARDGVFYCLPAAPQVDPAQLAGMLLNRLPGYVANLVRPDDAVLMIGPGYGLDAVLLSRKVRALSVLEANGPAAEMLMLSCRLNNCANAKVEHKAAYDHNAIAEFWRVPTLLDGVMDVAEGGKPADAAIEGITCARIDDHYAETDVMVLLTGGHGDASALFGAQKTLAKMRLLFMDFNWAYYQAKPELIDKVAGLLDQSFVHAYAPHLSLKDNGSGFAPLFRHLVAQQSSGTVIFTRDALV